MTPLLPAKSSSVALLLVAFANTTSNLCQSVSGASRNQNGLSQGSNQRSFRSPNNWVSKKLTSTGPFSQCQDKGPLRTPTATARNYSSRTERSHRGGETGRGLPQMKDAWGTKPQQAKKYAAKSRSNNAYKVPIRAKNPRMERVVTSKTLPTCQIDPNSRLVEHDVPVSDVVPGAGGLYRLSCKGNNRTLHSLELVTEALEKNNSNHALFNHPEARHKQLRLLELQMRANEDRAVPASKINERNQLWHKNHEQQVWLTGSI